MFEIDANDAALARFAELRPDPRRIPPNAATRAYARHVAIIGDSAAVRSNVSDDFRFEDRGKRALLSGDVEAWIASVQFRAALPGVRARRELIGTVGDRIAIHRLSLTGAPDGAAFEIQDIRLMEVDTDGRLRAVILFDLDDRRAAFAEAQARFQTGEAAAIGGQAPIAALSEAFSRRDWDALREGLVPELVYQDHRILGLGTLARDPWIESLRALVDLAADVEVEMPQILAWNRHGRVAVERSFGTNLAGGPFENVSIAVVLSDGDRIQCREVFDLEDAERAMARFEELCVR